jgi:C-terminal binding-module, SLH-like, of glucodextranase
MTNNPSPWLVVACATLTLAGSAARAEGPITTGPNGGFTMTDPVGDDNGPGTYVYPTDAVYKPGSFDIVEFKVVPNGDQVEFHLTLNARIEDPWDSTAWGGNGFSIQMAFIHIDQDHKKGSGVTVGLPGTNVRFSEDEAWDKVVLISPQGPTRVNSEVDSKAPQWKDRIIVPKITRASGKTLIAVVDTAQLGGPPQESWGYQVLMQSNEGFPDKTDLLTRKINEFEGQHRFGGGTDYDNDPHVLDILVPPGGDPVAKQHDILSRYNKNATTDVKPEDWAMVPMVYPFAALAPAGAQAAAAGSPPGTVAVAGAAAAPASPSAEAAAPQVTSAAPVARGGSPLNWEMNGKIYTKYMYQNDATQGCLSISNPFWVDNIGGHNGVCTEFEMNLKARVSDKVSAGVRLQSRWGALWQDWWENGDLKPQVYDTSGESQGMNHAAYIKLRGAFARVAPPIPTVRWVTIGSTDYSMWNEWTIGKARYIDRDNGAGVFVEGDVIPKSMTYTVGAMALPKLWAGPGWQTGLASNDSLAKLYGTDWAFAAKLDGKVYDDLKFKLVGSWLQDWEPDKYSPSLTGTPDASRCQPLGGVFGTGTSGCPDHSVAMATRFRGLNATLDGVWTPRQWEWLSVSGLFAGSSNYVNPNYATNQVLNGQGFSPVVFKCNGTIDQNGNCTDPGTSRGLAGKILVEAFNPWKNGISIKLEYFNIGSEYNAVMGSRREADVLLTDGVITSGFTRGGQLPTLNIANEFQDWDEPWYESSIGWHGLTAVGEYVSGPLKATFEATGITYNTNTDCNPNTDAKGNPVTLADGTASIHCTPRDVKYQYPNFLYTNGFTDTSTFTADSDYANKYDRGRDPRSVYNEYQDRKTAILVLNVQYLLPKLTGAVLNVKGKYVYDRDNRNRATDVSGFNPANDDYIGRMYMGFAQLTLQATNELKTTLGYELMRWVESGRDGSAQQGFSPTDSWRHTARVGLTYSFGGANLSYLLEYLHKDMHRDPAHYYDLVWNVLRAKGTFEVAW